MTPPILVGAGLAAVALGLLVLRSFGPAYRIGRLLAATRSVGIDEARRLAASGERQYVAVTGRIDAATDFEDEHHRPLVFRRTRVEARRDGRWQTLNDRREAVDFEIGEALATIAIDHAALDEGLVVIPRESVGVAGDAPEALPVPLAPQTPVRIRIEQVSSVEHAIVVGVAVADVDGTPQMTGIRGNPLILTTLERAEAMRVLAGGGRERVALAAVALIAGVGLVVAGIAWGLVGAAAPGPSAAPPGASASASSPADAGAGAGDTRSAGEGPGFVGAPLFALGGVLAIGLGAAGSTLLYVRLTGGPGVGALDEGDETDGGRDGRGRPGAR